MYNLNWLFIEIEHQLYTRRQLKWGYFFVYLVGFICLYVFICPNHGIWKFPGQVSNPCHSSDNTGSLNCWASREFWWDYLLLLLLGFFFVFCGLFFFFCPFRATHSAYGGSQARGWIGTTAASLHHSHSNTRFEPCQIHFRCIMTGTSDGDIFSSAVPGVLVGAQQ